MRRLALFVLILSTACSEHEPRLALTDSEIFGPSTIDVEGAVGPLDAAVGRLPGCSATAVTRNSVITARHCLCGKVPAQISFCLPTSPGGCNGAPGSTSWSTGASSFAFHAPPWDGCNYLDGAGHFVDGSIKGTDVAVVFLANTIPTSVLPDPLPKVYLGDDALSFGETLSASLGGTPVYFITGFGGTDFSEMPPNGGIRRRGIAGSDLHYEENGGTFDNIWVLESDANDDPAAIDTIAHGDSGGALFMQPMVNGLPSGPPYLIGVNSGTSQVAWDDDQQWAITGNLDQLNASEDAAHNSDVVALALAPDVDGDGVLDPSDNCPPAACSPNNVPACADPTQADSDGDGVGNVCDRCPAINESAGFGVPGPDLDGDGLGDVCDPCPYFFADFYSDADGDNVGDQCDLCPGKANAYPVCNTNAQCTNGNYCRKANGAATGRCSKQPDLDGDLLGDACDICPDNAANGTKNIQANSNVDREANEGVVALGDVCDPVPQYVAKPNFVDFAVQNANCPIGAVDEACKHAVRLYASSTLGSPSTTFSAPVGFRHCDCYTGIETVLDRAACMLGQCAIVPSDYSSATSHYKRITIGPDGTYPSYPATLTAPTFPSRTFTSVTTNADQYFHPEDQLSGNGEYDLWRVGPTELLVWPWRDDVAAGHIDGHPAGDPVDNRKTAGILWSIAMQTTFTSSTRDLSSGQRLRSVYSYFETPLIGPVPEVPYSGSGSWLDCAIVDCFGFLRKDLPVINPADHRLTLRFHNESGQAVISGGPSFAPIVADDELSPEIQAQLLSASNHWIAPVESGRVLRSTAPAIAGAYLPASWDVNSEVSAYRYSGDQVHGEMVPKTSVISPQARTNYLALLALSERAVYMIGGTSIFGDPTHDFWRFDLDRGVWRRLMISGEGIENVISAAYAPSTRGMIVLDRDPATGQIRLISVNLATKKAKALASFAYSGRFEHLAVEAEEDGRFLLLASSAASRSTTAWRFTVSITGAPTLRWIGEGTYAGTLLDSGQLTDDGVVLPMVTHGRLQMPAITATDLRGRTTGPSGL